MPANLTPAYKAAEAEFRRARKPEERLRFLREMLRTVPKHKGTEHLQADIKTRIKELTDELAGPKKGGARTASPTTIRPEGAGQAVLIGPPNSGKSALHARLTGSQAAVGEYAFTTQFPLPGMFPYTDVAFQLVDLPPISRQHPVPWLANALRPADAAVLVVDLGNPACVEEVTDVHEMLAERRVHLTESWAAPLDDVDDPFALYLPTLLVASKADQVGDLEEELGVFEELTGYRYPALPVSAETGEGTEALGRFLFENLGVVRVYSKAPGRPADMTQPFTLRRGQTVEDVAVLIHKELASTVTFARLWSGGVEKRVGREHPVEDGDVVELHVQ